MTIVPIEDAGGLVEKNLKSLFTKVVLNGVGPLTGSVDYAHSYFRDPRGSAASP